MKLIRLYLFFLLLFSGFFASANEEFSDKYRSVVARKVGHEFLSVVGDRNSLVTAVTKEGNRYTIEFASEFEFVPDVLKAVTDSVMNDAGIKSSYFIEVLKCSDDAVVYETFTSVDPTDSTNVSTCMGRPYPKDCYKLAITFIGVNGHPPVAKQDIKSVTLTLFDPSDPYSWSLLVGALLLLLSAYAYFRRKKFQNVAEHVIPIGAYLFDQRNMHLTFNGDTVELTSKEADLLFLLHSSKNETVERDTILRIVWGDEGDYVGRTLDVFISKLRKKLSGDPAIKIANIRGVGYRLVVDASAA